MWVVVLTVLVAVPATLRPYLPAKVLAVAVVVGVAGVAVRSGRVPRRALAAWGGLLLVAGLSASLAPQPIESWLGTPGRFMGVVTWALFAAAFVVGCAVADRDGRDVVPATIRALAVAVLVAGSVAIVEAWVGWSNEFDGRPGSVFGNPAVLSGFLLLGLPACAWLATRQGHWRWVGITAGGLGAVALWLARTRAAWLAAAVVVLLALVWLWSRRRSWAWLAAAGAMAATGITIAVVRREWLVEGLAGRLGLWRMGWRASGEAPVLGHGPDSFVHVFPRVVDQQFVTTWRRTDVYDRAHNLFLDVALDVGLVGLALHIALLVVVAMAARRLVRADDTATTSLVFGMVGYLLAQQSMFPDPAVDAVFWLLGGLAVGRSMQLRDRQTPAFRVPRMAVAGLALPLALVAGLAVVADQRLQHALSQQSVQAFQDAASLRSSYALPYLAAGSVFRESADPEQVESALAFVRDGREVLPMDQSLRFAEMNLQLALFRLTGDSDILADVATALEAMVAVDDANGEAELKLGTVRYRQGDHEAARAHWERAAVLLPESPVPERNLSQLPS